MIKQVADYWIREEPLDAAPDPLGECEAHGPLCRRHGWLFLEPPNEAADNYVAVAHHVGSDWYVIALDGDLVARGTGDPYHVLRRAVQALR
jgi:hypothetical protein